MNTVTVTAAKVLGEEAEQSGYPTVRWSTFLLPKPQIDFKQKPRGSYHGGAIGGGGRRNPMVVLRPIAEFRVCTTLSLRLTRRNERGPGSPQDSENILR